MGIKIDKDKLKSMICYWIECRHVYSALIELTEDTDEIGELYEINGWLENNQTGDQISMMDVHVRIEEAEALCYKLNDQVSEILPMVIREYGNVLYPQELGVHMHDLKDDWYNEILEYLDESIQEIYEYQTDVQFENFCRVFGEACEFIRKRHASADRNKEEPFDPDNLPFS